MMDGTIINHSPPAIVRKVGGATACIGLVAADPTAAARHGASILRSRGFSADVVVGVEPGMPVAFLVTNALAGSCLNFRPHVIHMLSRS
jgi:orotate phosphoribosyltransferase-like protein